MVYVLVSVDKFLDFGFIETGAVEFVLKLQRPDNAFAVRRLKQLNRTAEQNIEIAGNLGTLVFIIQAKEGQLIGDFSGFFRCLLDFRQRDAEWMGGLNLSEHKRGMSEDGGKRVIKIQRDRSRQVQSAIELLFVGEVVLDAWRAGGRCRRR